LTLWFFSGPAACQAAEEPAVEWTEVVPPAAATWDDLPPAQPGPEDWPCWHGPKLDNCAARPQDPPVRWSQTENVVWKADLPGLGYGSPSLWGHRIFLATADNSAQVQYLLCYDRPTGKKLWQTEIHRGGFMLQHKKGTQANSTAACDGQRVFISFMVQGGVWLSAVDLDGKLLWQKKAAPFQSKYGYGASPVFYKSLVIVPADNPGVNYLTALRRDTGEIAWRIHRMDYQSNASAIVARVCGRDQLVITGPKEVSSYDPNTGRRLWYCDGPAKEAVTTPAYDDQHIYAAAGYPERRLFCIRADGSGDVSGTHLVWQMKTNGANVPSPLCHDGLLYMVNDNGLLFCFRAPTGEELWRKQLEGAFSASPVLAGGNIYLPNETGVTYVFQHGREFRLVATNDLGDGGFASPVICGSRIYLRTRHWLYCLGKTDGQSPQGP
jgi:hypothetical protein